MGAGKGTVLPVYQQILRATNKTQHVWSFKGSEKHTVHMSEPVKLTQASALLENTEETKA